MTTQPPNNNIGWMAVTRWANENSLDYLYEADGIVCGKQGLAEREHVFFEQPDGMYRYHGFESREDWAKRLGPEAHKRWLAWQRGKQQ